jgi:hypothetical protein
MRKRYIRTTERKNCPNRELFLFVFHPCTGWLLLRTPGTVVQILSCPFFLLFSPPQELSTPKIQRALTPLLPVRLRTRPECTSPASCTESNGK